MRASYSMGSGRGRRCTCPGCRARRREILETWILGALFLGAAAWLMVTLCAVVGGV